MKLLLISGREAPLTYCFVYKNIDFVFKFTHLDIKSIISTRWKEQIHCCLIKLILLTRITSRMDASRNITVHLSRIGDELFQTYEDQRAELKYAVIEYNMFMTFAYLSTLMVIVALS